MKRYIYLLLIGLTLINAGRVRAQAVDLSLAPSRHEIVAKPGSTIQLTYTMVNKGDPVYVTAGVLPFTPTDSSGAIVLDSKNRGDLQFTPGNDAFPLEESIFMKQGDARELVVDLTVPRTLKDSDHYYAAYVRTEPPPGVEGALSVRLQQQIVSPIFVTVSRTGTVSVRPDIALFTIIPKREYVPFKGIRIVDSEAAVPVSATVANNGPSAFMADGTLTVSHIFGTHTFTIPEQRILAGSTKALELPAITNAYFGPVQVRIALNYGESGIKNYSNITYYALPYRMVPAIVIPLLLTVAAVLYVRRGKR